MLSLLFIHAFAAASAYILLTVDRPVIATKNTFQPKASVMGARLTQ